MPHHHPKFPLKSFYPLYIGSEAREVSKTLSVTNKYTHAEICKVSVASEKEIDEGIQRAYDCREKMRKFPAYKRQEVLQHVVDRVIERKDEFAYVLCLEAGKPIKDAKGEVERLIDTFRLAAEECTRIYGEYLPLDISERGAGCQGITKRFPVGVVSMISPWNFPLNLVAHKVAPAIAAGCPFVLKPASKTPLGALMLAEILAETDLPTGAFSVLPCTREGAELFTVDDRLACMSFTGSTDVGWKLKSKSGKKHVILELGGNAPCIVDKLVVDINHVTNRLIHGAFYQSGQSCISVQRIYVHEHIFECLVQMLIEKVQKLKTGDPLDEDTFIGPLISEDDAKRCYEWVQEAVREGAEVLVGGDPPEGSVFKPTILTNVSKKSKVHKEEVFGPVCIVEKVDCFKDAVDECNDTTFGLQAGVFSNHLHHCYYAFDTLEYGGVVINDVPSVRVDSMPYGGIKDSGLGREGVRYAIHEYTDVKIMLLKDVGCAGMVEQ